MKTNARSTAAPPRVSRASRAASAAASTAPAAPDNPAPTRHVSVSGLMERSLGSCGLSVLRDLLDQLAGLLRPRFLGDVGLGENADHTAVLLDDRQPPDLMRRHQPQRLVEVLLRVDGDRRRRRDLTRADGLRVLALGDDAHHDV